VGLLIFVTVVSDVTVTEVEQDRQALRKFRRIRFFAGRLPVAAGTWGECTTDSGSKIAVDRPERVEKSERNSDVRDPVRSVFSVLQRGGTVGIAATWNQ
jgi:hypothetical protein